MYCDRCGVTVDEDAGGIINAELGYANCGPCEEDYQAGLAAEYPNGQCGECGAAYYAVTRRDGTEELRAWHAEGGCSQWRDYADEDAAAYDAEPAAAAFDPIAYEDAEQAYFTALLAQAQLDVDPSLTINDADVCPF